MEREREAGDRSTPRRATSQFALAQHEQRGDEHRRRSSTPFACRGDDLRIDNLEVSLAISDSSLSMASLYRNPGNTTRISSTHIFFGLEEEASRFFLWFDEERSYSCVREAFEVNSLKKSVGARTCGTQAVSSVSEMGGGGGVDKGREYRTEDGRASGTVTSVQNWEEGKARRRRIARIRYVGFTTSALFEQKELEN